MFIPPGGSGGTDHFAPKYIVGNVPAGDSAADYSADGFSYFADTGNGAGIEAALAAAGLVAGDVWIRPGTYALGARVLTVPATVRVMGSGFSTSITKTNFALGVAAFDLGNGAILRDLIISASVSEAPGGAATGVVRTAGLVVCENVLVSLTVGGFGALNTPIRAAFHVSEGSRATFRSCRATLAGTTYAVNNPIGSLLAGWRTDGPGESTRTSLLLDACTSAGGDASVVLNSDMKMSQTELLASTRYGIVATSTSREIDVVGSEIDTAGTSAILVQNANDALQRFTLSASTVVSTGVDGEAVPNSTAVDSSAATGQIVGNKIVGGPYGVDTAAATVLPGGHTIVANVISATVSATLTRAADEAAHNIAL
jgi:hypothetical protein